MDISNRSLVLLLVVTLVLVASAGVLTLGASLTSSTDDDADLVATPVAVTTVVPRVERSGGKKIDPDGPLLVTTDEAGAVGTALLVCDMYKSERPFVKLQAVFPTIPFGTCNLTMSGTKSSYGPVYPGDELICSAAGGKTACSGGAAAANAATVSFTSVKPGSVDIDEASQGRLPVNDIKVNVGKRDLLLRLDDGRTFKWVLMVQPGETIHIAYPDPDGGSGQLLQPVAAGQPQAPQPEVVTPPPDPPKAN